MFAFADWFCCVVAAFVSVVFHGLQISFWFGVVPIHPHLGVDDALSSEDSLQLGLSHRISGCQISSPSSLRGFRYHMV